jgi:hypothetical protein
MFMKKIVGTAFALTLIAFIFNQCTTDENNPVASNDPVIDPISNTWTDSANSEHRFVFVTYDSTVSRGIFFGAEDHPDSITVITPELHGFFDKTYVEFDVIWEGTEFTEFKDTRVKFKGNFVNSNRMELQSSEGRIVLTR